MGAHIDNIINGLISQFDFAYMLGINIITYILPFAFTAYYPASYILRGNNPWFCFGAGTVIATVLLTLSVLLWNKGINAYESAGS